MISAKGAADDGIHRRADRLAAVLTKARFWERHADVSLLDRQRLVLNRLLGGFEGKLTSSKYAKLAKCSQDTASRDIDDLISHGILAMDPGGELKVRLHRPVSPHAVPPYTPRHRPKTGETTP